MSSRPPARSAVANRPSTKDLAGIAPRRTSAEVKAAKAAEKKALVEERGKAKAKEEQVKARIGQLEDDLRREDLRRQKGASRPDLHDVPEEVASETLPSSKRKPTLETATSRRNPKPLENEVDEVETAVALLANRRGKPAVGIASRRRTNPLENEFDDEDLETVGAPLPNSDDDDELPVATEADERQYESDASSAWSLPATSESDGEFLDADEDDYDREDDADYEMSEVDKNQQADDADDDKEMEREIVAAQPKPKPSKRKPQKAGLSFRDSIGDHRKTTADSAVSKGVTNKLKRKSDAVQLDEVQPVKTPWRRSKTSREEPGGLLKGYKPKQSLAPVPEPSSDIDDVDNLVGGCFDEDEDEKSIQVAREGKDNRVGGVKENEVAVVDEPEPKPANRPARYKKEHCTYSNLPFPSSQAHLCRPLYKRDYKSTVAVWSAARKNPFESGTVIAEITRPLWAQVFGELAPLTKNDPRWFIVDSVANTGLLSMRSDLGKHAISVTVKSIRGAMKVISEDGGQDVAEFLLKDYRFVYGNPDAEEGESAEPFQGELVLKTFTRYLKHAVYCIKEHKVQTAVGAIALCAAAVERALTLIRDGHINVEIWPPAESGEGEKGKRVKAKYEMFSEEGWGSATRGYVETAERLSRDSWKVITEKATTAEIEAILETLSGDEDSTPRAADNSRAKLRM